MIALDHATDVRPHYTDLRRMHGPTTESGRHRARQAEHIGQHRAVTLGEAALAHAMMTGNPGLIETAHHLLSREEQNHPGTERDIAAFMAATTTPRGDVTPGHRALREYQTDMTTHLPAHPRELLGAHTIRQLDEHPDHEDQTAVIPRQRGPSPHS